jgi:hypothetical protein
MRILVTLIFAYFCLNGLTQINNGGEYFDDSPGIIIGTGATLYSGSFSSNEAIKTVKTSIGNFHIDYFHPITAAFILKVGFLKTQFNYWDKAEFDVRAKISSFNLSANYRFDNGKVIKKKLGFSPYLGLGVGFFSVKAFADNYSEDGDSYFYWSDGIVRNSDEETSTVTVADTIYRDYVYETNVTDSLLLNYGLQSFVELGIAMKFTPNLTGQISYKYLLLLNDVMIGVSEIGASDRYGYFSVGIGFNFGGIKKSEDQKHLIEQSNELGALDEDNDGVVDLLDKCAHSSSKSKVDKQGCPIDTDKDGVADFEDVEPKSINTNVNEKGKSYTSEELEVLYLLKSGAINGHEKYIEYRKKYPDLFRRFNQDTETLGHKSESVKE